MWYVLKTRIGLEQTYGYVDFNPIYCHDRIMPYVYGKSGKRALFNPKAVAFEKAGETNDDEYKRKVRMNRDILDMLSWGIKVCNPFKYGWFGVFYFGHRTCRYCIWLSHHIMFFSSIGLLCTGSVIGVCLVFAQIFFFWFSYLSIKKQKYRSKLLNLVCYYGMTVIAQTHGVYNIITGKAKPTWDNNTRRLNLEETKEKIASLAYIQERLAGEQRT